MQKYTPKTGALCADLSALTDAYVVKGGVLSGHARDQIVVLVRWTKGDETSLEMKVEFSDTPEFTAAYNDSVLDIDPATGVALVLAKVYQFTTASGNYKIAIPSQGQYFRVSFKATGGTPTGTIGADYRIDTVSKG